MKLRIDLDIGAAQLDNCHGRSALKDMVVLHETISPDYPGLADIRGVSEYLDQKDYGIHAIADADGNLAWAKGLRRCTFYHTASSGSYGSGNVNTRSIGIELVSRIPSDFNTNASRFAAWWKRRKQLDKAALLIAWLSKQEPIPLDWSDGSEPGVTTHWQVTKRYGVPGGHTDCWPRHLGGYFPAMYVIHRARAMRPFVTADFSN